MITRVFHGWRIGGLIAYLMGPGRAEDHVRPRVVASWDGRDAAWQPSRTGPGEFDLELGPLIRAMRAPVIAANLPERDQPGKRGYVWHCPVRVAGADRLLSDAEWASIARELLDGAGIATTGDAGGPRWVAIRHAADHIHLAVVLVRQDTCRRFWPSHDFPRLRATARRIEQRLGLTVTAAGDGTAARASTRGEIEKARRLGREPARLELARAVRVAAVAADGPDGFVAALREAGYLVELRRAPSGDPLGYKVARRGDETADGNPVFYSGSKLASDLSLPRLLRAWELAGRGSEAASPVDAARRRADQARAAVASARGGRGGEDPNGIAHATLDVLTAGREWSAAFDHAAAVFDRAARAPRGESTEPGPAAAGLRRVARQLIRQRRIAGAADDPDAAAVALAVALAALMREVAAWQRERQRVHQAAASVSAAEILDRWAAEQPSTPSPANSSVLDHAGAAREQRRDPPARRRSGQPRG